jgi:tetratricopeptide (TPR) repeat protein
MFLPFLLIAAGAVAAAPADDLAAVERAASQLVSTQPTAENWQKLGLARYLQNRFEPAIEAFSEAVRRNPNLWTSHLFLGISRYRTNRFPLALAALELADRLAPPAAPGRDDVDYWLGATRVALKQPLRGLEALERLLARNPRHLQALQLSAETYSETASSLWNRVADRAFNTAAGQEVHGYALESEGNRAGAIEAFRSSLAIDPQRSGPGAALGRLLLSSGEAAAAAEVLRQELRNDPASPEANLYLGLWALRENQPEQARGLLETASSWLPDNEEPTLALCQAYLLLGDASRAVSAARRAVQADGSSLAAHELLLAALAAANDRSGAESEQKRWLQYQGKP